MDGRLQAWQWVFSACAAFPIFAAAWIVRVQLRAKSCPNHSHTAGRLAWLLAGLLALGSFGLLIFAWIVLPPQ